MVTGSRGCTFSGPEEWEGRGLVPVASLPCLPLWCLTLQEGPRLSLLTQEAESSSAAQTSLRGPHKGQRMKIGVVGRAVYNTLALTSG